MLNLSENQESFLREIYPTTDSLLGLEDKLGNSFFRCHKSFIINIDKIEKIAPISDRVYEISFDNHPQKVSMRRKKFEELISIMSKTRK